MYIKRLIDNHLNKWSISNFRKPLLLRGARQIGKSSAVRELGKKFSSFLEINFEENINFEAAFEEDLDPKSILGKLSIISNFLIVPGETLLFFDEIQVCPRAIQSLRFFYEKMPELHVIATGSLLEFALAELPSFGVGRIDSLYMYPISFEEFIIADGNETMINEKRKGNINTPMNEIVHKKLLEYLRIFIVIGGMPEAVKTYVQTKSLLQVQKVLSNLYNTFIDDFKKYQKKIPSSLLVEVIEAVCQQTGNKFIFSKVSDRSQFMIQQAVQLLIQAGLIHPITHTAASGLPIGAQADARFRKLIFLDTGIQQRILGLHLSEIIISDTFSAINKGSLAEQFWGLEYLKYSDPSEPTKLYYWIRTDKGSDAEVDYIIQSNESILPVEVKSAGSGKMQSLRYYLNLKKQPFGYRFSLENYSAYENIIVYPLYGVNNFLQDLGF